jgi:hypothetical protein
MINAGPINAGPINATSVAQSGSTAHALIKMAGSAHPIHPLLSLVTDQSKILVFTVEIYPAFISDRDTAVPAIILESGEYWATESDDVIGIE